MEKYKSIIPHKEDRWWDSRFRTTFVVTKVTKGTYHPSVVKYGGLHKDQCLYAIFLDSTDGHGELGHSLSCILRDKHKGPHNYEILPIS